MVANSTELNGLNSKIAKRNLKVLLVEPKKSIKYHTPYPPLGLLKLARFHRERHDDVRLINGTNGQSGYAPDIIYVTSLFTYAWEPVHEVIKHYSAEYPKAKVIVGGIYASLCTEHLEEAFGSRIEVIEGLLPEIENLLPDYSLIPDWNASILFSSRGCIRRCKFCSVPQLEPDFIAKESIKHLIYPGHRKVILWDNNILASPHWRNVFDELEELGLEADFNQGLDARLITEEVATRVKRMKVPTVRLAYDSDSVKAPLEKAISLLKEVGVDGRRIIVYCLYGFLDTPQDFFHRITDLVNWGVVTYPMRYQPLEPCSKDSYVPSNWQPEQLEMVARARRVIGYGGAFPPYEGLKKKLSQADNFDEAFSLRPKREVKN